MLGTPCQNPPPQGTPLDAGNSLTDRIAGCWPLYAYGNYCDISGNNNTLAPVNVNPQWGSYQGANGLYYQLQTTPNALVNTACAGLGNLTDAFSVAVVFCQYASYVGYIHAFTLGEQSTGHGHNLDWDGSVNFWRWRTGAAGSALLSSSGIANPTLPHLLVMTYSGGSTATGSIYMDGALTGLGLNHT